ncbi:MAG: cytochrome c [Armatimonadetes bacterium]|nr:cytochrome c [Armatimonadota bacterium]
MAQQPKTQQAEPQPPQERQLGGFLVREGRVPWGLLLLYAVLPLWGIYYMFSGLSAPEITPRPPVAVAPPAAPGAPAPGAPGAAPPRPGAPPTPAAPRPPDAFTKQAQEIIASVPEAERGKTRPQVSPAALAAAKQQFGSLCAICHGPQGRGDGPAGAGMTPPPMNFAAGSFVNIPEGVTFYVVKHAVMVGGKPRSAMPPFGSSLSDEQIWALVAYLRDTFAK